MGLRSKYCGALLHTLYIFYAFYQAFAGNGITATQNALLLVDASSQSGRKMPDNLFGIFFEEINHAGAGGLWAELVSNRGFEAGGPNTPSNIDPWVIIGNESQIIVSTDRTSCFARNKVALRMEVLCDDKGSNTCPAGGVGVYNPGFWGMNIERGKAYKVILHIKSFDSVKLSVSLVSSDGRQNLATHNIIAESSELSNWTKMEFLLKSRGTNANSRLQLTTTESGTIWVDQVSVLPLDTYMGDGFRKGLASMLANLKPRFLRYPGGSYVEGEWLRNAFRWSETVGPWEERPGHFNDVWKYWTDDGLGFFEFLQLAEDLGASPVWVANSGISHNDQVSPSVISGFVQNILDGIEFARGDPKSQWGSIRATMGHPEPFQLNYVSLGNQDCWKKQYIENYLKFYSAIKAAYPDIKIVTNCDGSFQPLNHPADLYDIHVYTSSGDMFSRNHEFDRTTRNGPKAFVSEYAVTGNDAGKGTLVAALAEAGFLIGIERNSDVVEMASCAPLFVNDNDRQFNPDAIVFNSRQQYGTPSYWMQHFFKHSSGAIFHPSTIQAGNYTSLVASAITWQNSHNDNTYLKIKIVNYGGDLVNLKISVTGLENNVDSSGSINTLLTSSQPQDENSFQNPKKVVPVHSALPNAGTKMDVAIAPYSLTSFDLLLNLNGYKAAI
ncbi:alpha-L-arabinofuranosidase 1-like isoform X1 [Ananas comosus]|uniref:non-reducing end alpha-L-arabinofuranosidase n=1 Tax=Ananas comosus TaxID=4615 RepID=A0A6P5GIU7_ANACO|nr:alpha-L-arabinofuranosidase 1-like isoform X1 [Ananas comosus]